MLRQSTQRSRRVLPAVVSLRDEIQDLDAAGILGVKVPRCPCKPIRQKSPDFAI